MFYKEGAHRVAPLFAVRTENPFHTDNSKERLLDWDRPAHKLCKTFDYRMRSPLCITGIAQARRWWWDKLRWDVFNPSDFGLIQKLILAMELSPKECFRRWDQIPTRINRGLQLCKVGAFLTPEFI
jgi:hypothetical protein